MKRFLFLAVMLCSLMACENQGINPKKSLHLTPQQKQMVGVSNDFSFNLLNRVAAQQSDCFISPLSASFALSMLANGAEGTTQTQILNVLGFNDFALDELNDFHAELLSTLPKMEKSTKINIANAVFVQNDFLINDSYVRSMKDIYKATAQNVDFSDPSSINSIINKWASRATDNRIKQILSPQPYSDLVVLLANALSFTAKWENRFDAKDTRKEDFHNADGTTASVDMMNMTETLYAGEGSNYRVLSMPYKNYAFEMVVVLPKQGTSIHEVLDNLNPKTWLSDANMHEYEVTVKMPKFTFEYDFLMNDYLMALGMTDAFIANVADFNAMATGDSLYVSQVDQKTYLAIDEEGTEAHAVTSIILTKAESAAPEPMDFFVDQPFIFFIRERANGIVLFAGCRSNF